MTQNKPFEFVVDEENLRVRVRRCFDASLDRVWAAWTEAPLLEQWWAPKPFRAETKIMDFTEGGRWLYAMVSPQGDKHWGVKQFTIIFPRTQFTYRSYFCDEEGTVAPNVTGSTWINSFEAEGESTWVTNEITCDTLAHLQAQVKMGFKEGYAMGLDQLAALLAQHPSA